MDVQSPVKFKDIRVDEQLEMQDGRTCYRSDVVSISVEYGDN